MVPIRAGFTWRGRGGLPWLLLVCCALLAPTTGAADVLERRWREHLSENFRLVTDLDDRAAAVRIRELEMFRSVVLAITGQRSQAGRARVEVLLVSRPRDYSRLFGNEASGFFLSTLRSDRMVSGSGSVWVGEREILFHEYVHYLLRTGSSAHYPPWYNEGLAEMLSTVRVKGGKVQVGLPPVRVTWDTRGRLPITTLLHGSYATMAPSVANEFYVGAWQLVHYLHAGHLTGAPNRFGQMTDYLARMQQGIGSEAAFAAAFDISPLQLQREVDRYLQRGRTPVLQYDPGAFPSNADLASTDLSPAQAAYEIGDVLLYVDAERAEALLERGLATLPEAQTPLHARTLARAAVAMQFQDEHGAGYEVGRQAVALAPEDPLPRLELADLIASWCADAEPPADCDALLDEAEEHYREGLRIAPDDAEHRYGLARLQSSRGREVEQAFRELAALADSRPWSPELNLEAGRGAIAAGRAEAALPYLQRAYNFSHSAKFRARVAALLAQAGPGEARATPVAAPDAE
jgi:tetratricopeptide (TPR) repeat protein